MNFLPVDSVLADARVLAERLLPKGLWEIQEASSLRLKARIVLSQEAFVSLFYAPRTRRLDLSLIVSGRRTFGIDNLGGWHCHPTSNPAHHNPTNEPSLSEIFSEMGKAFAEQHLERRGQP